MFDEMAWLDHSLYPDIPPPDKLESVIDQEDFICRLCSAWDFGILPEMATIEEIRHPHWREAVDGCQLLTSLSYHLLREWHRLPEMPYLGESLPYIINDPQLQFV